MFSTSTLKECIKSTASNLEITEELVKTVLNAKLSTKVEPIEKGYFLYRHTNILPIDEILKKIQGVYDVEIGFILKSKIEAGFFLKEIKGLRKKLGLTYRSLPSLKEHFNDSSFKFGSSDVWKSLSGSVLNDMLKIQYKSLNVPNIFEPKTIYKWWTAYAIYKFWKLDKEIPQTFPNKSDQFYKGYYGVPIRESMKRYDTKWVEIGPQYEMELVLEKYQKEYSNQVYGFSYQRQNFNIKNVPFVAIYFSKKSTD